MPLALFAITQKPAALEYCICMHLLSRIWGVDIWKVEVLGFVEDNFPGSWKNRSFLPILFEYHESPKFMVKSPPPIGHKNTFFVIHTISHVSKHTLNEYDVILRSIDWVIMFCTSAPIRGKMTKTQISDREEVSPCHAHLNEIERWW